MKGFISVKDIYGPTIPLGVSSLSTFRCFTPEVYSRVSYSLIVLQVRHSRIVLHYRSSRSIIYNLAYIFSHCTSVLLCITSGYEPKGIVTAKNIKSSFSSSTTVSDTTGA